MTRKRVWLILAVAAAMVLALGVPLLAAQDDGAPANAPDATALTRDNAAVAGLVTPSEDGGAASIITGSGTWDSTVLTKYIPASAFMPYTDTGDQLNSQYSCATPAADTPRTTTAAYASVELPDGALLTGVTFYGSDADATYNMSFNVFRNRYFSRIFPIPPPPPVLTEGESIAAGASSGSAGTGAWFIDVPDTVTGSSGSVLTGINNDFFTLAWYATKAAGSSHKLCGAVVTYRVASTGDNQTFTPLAPCAIFDSRTSQGGTGTFAANEMRDITVTGDTSGIGGDGDCGIPTTATAVQVNVLVLSPAGTGTLKAWAQGATEPAGLVAVSNDLPRWNGSSTVPIAANDQMSVKMKNTAAEVRLVVTGYFSAVSNMGN